MNMTDESPFDRLARLYAQPTWMPNASRNNGRALFAPPTDSPDFDDDPIWVDTPSGGLLALHPNGANWEETPGGGLLAVHPHRPISYGDRRHSPSWQSATAAAPAGGTGGLYGTRPAQPDAPPWFDQGPTYKSNVQPPARPRPVMPADLVAPPTPATDAAKLGWSAAQAVAPHLTDYLTTPTPPPSYTPNAAGKIPSADHHPSSAGAWGDVANLLSAAMPFGGPVGRVGAGMSGLLRRSAPAARAEAEASRNVSLYNPPVKPQRPFSEDYRPVDYPHGVPADATGRLTRDIEGRPLTARYVVGRRVVGGDDQAFPPAELNALGEATTGRRPATASAGEMGSDAGRYLKRPGDRLAELEYGQRPADADGWIRRTLIRDNLAPGQAQNALAHEIAEAIQDRAGQQVRYLPTPSGSRIPFGAIPEKGLTRQLGQVYHDLNDPTWRRGNTTPPRLQTKPEDFGYRGDDVRSERIVEGIRAYMANPNYLKTVAPDVAKAIREAVNSHPVLSKIIQFNSLAALLAGGIDSESTPDPNQYE
jgi:hypothetical protein